MKQFTFQGGAQGESVVSATGLTLAVRVAWLARDGQGFPVPLTRWLTTDPYHGDGCGSRHNVIDAGQGMWRPWRGDYRCPLLFAADGPARDGGSSYPQRLGN